LIRQAGANLGANVLVLLLALGTGTTLARTLGTNGRGQLAAIMVAPVLIAAVVEMGCTQAITYEHARDVGAKSWLLATWLFFLLPVVVIGVIAGEFLIHLTLSHQDATVKGMASWYMTLVAVVVIGDVPSAILLGDHRFRYINVQRVVVPMATLIGYLGMLMVGRLTVMTALLVTYCAAAANSCVTLGVVCRRYGFGRFNWSKGRSSLWYGFRAHGTNVSLLVNGRLDQLMLPAFVGASALGLYAVAVSVSSIGYYIAAPLGLLVLPAAARRQHDQPEIVRRATQAGFIIAVLAGVGLAVIAEPAVVHVYGKSFAGSVTAIWIMLPGYALYVAGYTLWQGLYAAGKPLASLASQLIGAVVTVVGLVLLLPRGGGINAAAAVSTLSYAAVAVASLVMYCRTIQSSPTRFLITRGRIAWASPTAGGGAGPSD
jgi:O-antigen/teichoic acid export membrane protein